MFMFGLVLSYIKNFFLSFFNMNFIFNLEVIKSEFINIKIIVIEIMSLWFNIYWSNWV